MPAPALAPAPVPGGALPFGPARVPDHHTPASFIQEIVNHQEQQLQAQALAQAQAQAQAQALAMQQGQYAGRFLPYPAGPAGAQMAMGAAGVPMQMGGAGAPIMPAGVGAGVGTGVAPGMVDPALLYAHQQRQAAAAAGLRPVTSPVAPGAGAFVPVGAVQMPYVAEGGAAGAVPAYGGAGAGGVDAETAAALAAMKLQQHQPE